VDQELRAQTFRAAVTAGSPCHFLDELANWKEGHPWGDDHRTWDLTLRDRIIKGLPDPGTEALRRNLALALLTLSELEVSLKQDLLPADIPAALGNLFLPGRYQHLLKNPDWFVDTGHNTQALGGILLEFLAGGSSGRNILLYGAMYDKDIAPELAGVIGRFDAVLGAPVSLPRSRTSEELEGLFAGWGLSYCPWPGPKAEPLPPCTVAPDMEQALQFLARDLQSDDRVLVTGSCFTVAEVFHKLGFTRLEMTRGLHEAGPIMDRIKD
jgi:dihydrofolate synthase/folylpolyglutamate synthase